MNQYQLLYIIKSDVSDEEKSNIVDKYSQLIESLGGTVSTVEKWGVKKFAYVIDKMKEGYYVLVKFTSSAAVPSEIDRQMKINDSIVRQMITRVVDNKKQPVVKEEVEKVENN